MKRTNDQNIRLHAIIGKLGLDKDLKEELIYRFTGGRETSSANMEYTECEGMISHLQMLVNGNGVSDPANKMRKKIFSVAHELGWEKKDGKIDYAHFNAWMLKYSYLHKALMDYKLKELPELVTQIEKLLVKSFAK